MLKIQNDFDYYTYKVGRYKPYEWLNEDAKRDFVPYKAEINKLVWNIFAEDVNSGKIKVYNLFEYCWPFLVDLVKIKKKYKDNFIEFAEDVRSTLQYYYWAKSERETIITSWPPYIEADELERLNNTKEELLNNNGKFYRTSVNLNCSYKIDIYTQIMMNWDRFIEYLWNNKKLITKKKFNLD